MKKRNIGISLIVLAYISGFFTFILPLVLLEMRIGIVKANLSQWWATNGTLIITGIVVFILLNGVGNWLRKGAKKGEETATLTGE